MKIEKYINDDGEFRCFGFSNTFFHKSDVKKFLDSFPNLVITSFTKAMWAEVFCEFRYKGLTFSVLEPYGDNSFYEVLCDEPDTEALIEIYDKFCNISVSENVRKSNVNRLFFWIAILIIVGIFFRN